ncbi:MAG: hypothetical protein HYZ74_02410 [Elusimicrobia bacterium]|nr:hypothetical protein [Elusimicrobiota bacterium]
MDALKPVTEWMRSTDLAEISYRKAGVGFSLTAAGAGDSPGAAALPSSRFIPVTSDGVGIFQWNEPGKPRTAHEGAEVAQGDVLGLILTGSGAAKVIKAARAGLVSKIFVDAGQAVEYGQPILLIDAR